jgi:hypothetical protein
MYEEQFLKGKRTYYPVLLICYSSLTFGRYNELCYGELILLGLY